MRRMRSALRMLRTLGALATLLAPSLRAQGLRPSFSALGGAVWLRTVIPGLTESFSGAAFGGAGDLSLARVGLTVSYIQGTLSSSGGSPSRDLVDGKILAHYSPVDWLTLKAGPHVRSYVVSGATQRWVFWEARARVEGGLIGPVVGGYAELWRALGASVNLPQGFDHSQGGEIGVSLRPARGPIRARLAYQIDDSQLGGGARLETVQTLLAEFGVTLP